MKIVPITAMPSAIPTCSNEPSIPLAEPTSVSRTPLRTMSNSGTKTMPIPIPPSRVGPAMSQLPTFTPVTASTPYVPARPTAIRARPMCSSRRPYFCIVMPEIAEPTSAPRAQGARARLARIGL
jgi:hypothetical protein